MSVPRKHDLCFVIGTMILSAKVKYGVGSLKAAKMSWTVLCAIVSAVFACAPYFFVRYLNNDKVEAQLREWYIVDACG